HGWNAAQDNAPARMGADCVWSAADRTPRQDQNMSPGDPLPQRKLGRHIDTFLGAQFLGEVLPTVPGGKDHDRVKNALDLCTEKIYMAQRNDGSYAADGWAPVLSSAFANNGLYAARSAGERV